RGNNSQQQHRDPPARTTRNVGESLPWREEDSAQPRHFAHGFRSGGLALDRERRRSGLRRLGLRSHTRFGYPITVTKLAWQKFALLAGVLAIVLLLPLLGRPIVLILTLAILGRCAYELYGSLRLPSPAFRTAVCLAYVVLGIAFLCFAIVLQLRSISYACMIVLAFSLRRYGFPR